MGGGKINAHATTPLRVLHVVEAFGGGLFEIVRAIADRHTARGHEVAVAYGVRPETPPDVGSFLDRRVEVFATPWQERSVAAQRQAVSTLRGIVGAWRPDVVHLHSSFAGVVGALAVPKRIPTVYTPQGYSFTMHQHPARRTAFILAERFVAARVSLVGACSHSEARLATDRVGAKRVTVVANGISALDDPPAAIRDFPRSARVVAIGRADVQRDPEGVARIMAAVRDVSSVEWIGGGRMDGVLRSAGIEVTGWLQHDETLRRLSEASVYLHWTQWDGLPLSIMEAMALDVPVVARDIPPNREVLGETQVCGTESEAIALTRRLIEDESAWRAAIERQRRRRPYYSARRMADEWEAHYQRLAASTGRGLAPTQHTLADGVQLATETDR